MDRGRTDNQGRTLTAAPAEGERRPGLRAIGAAGARIAAPIVARHGGGILGRLKAEWTIVAGPEASAASWPEALGRDGGLRLRVAPGFALELQHRAPLLIERINVFFGRTVVARLVIRQGTPPLGMPRRPARPATVTGMVDESLAARLADVADPELRAALAALGRLVVGRAADDETAAPPLVAPYPRSS